ncbi:MAG: hypothetical protein OXH65_08340 [Paracoccaceae bacterium]|nr:hypothetical protein [Paracoccaceae bacterium]MDE2675100.1 hypothetical protein [Paracoccaceae bacterium]MDE2739050.1 hypothetical protein [Paracoccaceae bacterium]
MFGNLDSFHNRVAESKEERDQHDKLLAVATKSQRLLIICTALMFLVAGLWLYFGSINEVRSTQALIVEYDHNLDDSNQMGTTEFLVWLDVEDASLLIVGTPVHMDCIQFSSNTVTLNGQVTGITPLVSNEPNLTQVMTELARGRPYKVGITNGDIELNPSMVEQKCSVKFVIGEVTPIQYFFSG